ncbi:MAG TPA: hypothetical protein VHE55_17905 [Fimbriimonadaceae bacterium]|nr:hypothetical protein [Fimbriimonadaceae bacterium]
MVVCAALLLVTAATAQGGGGGGRQGRQGRGGFGRMANDPGSLLRRSDVQTELKITDDEKTKLQDVQAKIQQERQDIRDNNQGDRQAAMQETMKKQPSWDKMVMAVLTADQQKRLKELIVQRSGNQIVYNAMFQDDLKLTDAQKAKFKDLQDKGREAMMGIFQNQDMSQDEKMAAFQKNQKTIDDEIGKTLTDDQKAKLKTMAGTPFKFEDNNGGGGR